MASIYLCVPPGRPACSCLATLHQSSLRKGANAEYLYIHIPFCVLSEDGKRSILLFSYEFLHVFSAGVVWLYYSRQPRNQEPRLLCRVPLRPSSFLRPQRTKKKKTSAAFDDGNVSSASHFKCVKNSHEWKNAHAGYLKMAALLVVPCSVRRHSYGRWSAGVFESAERPFRTDFVPTLT